jgi:prepilin-type N-terminal cleavage/methylation domain-containing protein
MQTPVTHHRFSRRGFTFFELLVVLAILATLAALVVIPADELRGASMTTVTERTLLALRDAIVGSDAQSGYRADVGELPSFVADLFQQPLTLAGSAALPVEWQAFDPVTRRGWRGPYLDHTGSRYAIAVDRGFTTQYGLAGWPGAMDAWCRPIVLQWPQLGGSIDPRPFVRLVSAGANGVLETPVNVAYPSRASCGDDVVLYVMGVDGRG